MNLFVIGFDREGGLAAAPAERVLSALREELPFFGTAEVQSWRPPSGRFAAASLAHPVERTAGVRYAHFEHERAGLFSGRPIRWGGDIAYGAAPLDPRRYMEPAASWSGSIGGRFAAARIDDRSGELELASDPLGAYPLYEAESSGARWFSNSAEALRRLSDAGEYAPATLAGLIGGGWSLDGDPLWWGVQRLRPGVLSLDAGGGETYRGLLDAQELSALFGAGFDPDATAELLVAELRALADWPGRANVVPVTGGRDSRLVLAAALNAGFDFTAVTGGLPEDPDFRIAQQLCELVGIDHEQLPVNPGGDPFAQPREAARTLMLTSAGTASLADASGFPLAATEGSLALWHSGQGGEIARAYYGSGEGLDAGGLVDHLFGAFVAHRPRRPELLTGAGEQLVRDQLAAFVAEQLEEGIEPADVPDAFYLRRRMATWAAPTHGAVEYARDTTSPLWSSRLLAAQLGLSREERAGELFHRQLLERLAPELVDVPFADGTGWGGAHGGSRGLAEKAFSRIRGRASRADQADEVFAETLERIREGTLVVPEDDPAWDVLDRGEVERLLGSKPQALDTMSRYRVWRLATVFPATA